MRFGYPEMAARISSARSNSKKYFSFHFLIDTVFNLSSGLTIGIIREICILGMTPEDCFDLRWRAMIFDVIFARPYSFFRKYMTKRFGVVDNGRFFGPQFWSDSVLLCVFWTTVYAINIGISCLLGHDILGKSTFFEALGWFALGAFASGRPYGYALDRIKRFFDRLAARFRTRNASS